MFLHYLQPWDAIFYPGAFKLETRGLRWRKRLGIKGPVIATLEGLVGNAERAKEYSALAGHQVYCQEVPADILASLDERNRHADHIIAISPFLERMGRSRFGDKFSMLPLGINTQWYYAAGRIENPRVRVVSAGTVYPRKRPDQMLELARRLPNCDFIWYGEGELRQGLLKRIADENLTNVSFPGPLPPQQLGEAFRAADLFVLPAYSEGVPKVSQEAAACGLAQVIYGFYEAPSVVHGENGYHAWNDEGFYRHISDLSENRALLRQFGTAGIAMAIEWDWRVLAARWRDRILQQCG
jgi:glycosyltransferase involved in cell wall biosynthesis